MDSLGLPMSIRLPDLPPSIEKVVVPGTFSVSSLAWLERCALSVLGSSYAQRTRTGGILAPHPLALLGTVLHHTRAELLNGRWGEVKDPRDAFRVVFQAAVESAEDQLRAEPYAANLVPLRLAVGRREWSKRIEQGVQWACSLDPVVSRRESPYPLGPLLGRASSMGVAADDAPRLGSEELLHDAELRIRGRPDWSEKRGPGLVAVSEFKSGIIEDEEGRLLEEHVLQVQAYALMIERAWPGVRVEPYIEGAKRVPVPWGELQRDRLMDRLRSLDERLPRGREFAAEDLAFPGSHCGFCRLRPLCGRYLREVPAWWRDSAGALRPLPLDVWGLVDQVNESRAGISLRLTDAAGRRVLVDGLAKASGLSEVSPGDAVWLFDLESSEDLDQHGAKVHPRNFHQYPPGPRWRLARRLRVFLGRR